MLTIRREQMAVLSDYMRKRFEDRIVRHLISTYPGQFQKLSEPHSGDGQVRAFVQEGVKKAVGYQIIAEHDVGRFIDLLVQLGPEFETRPDAAWARSILRDPKLTGRARVGLMEQQLAARSPVTPSERY